MTDYRVKVKLEFTIDVGESNSNDAMSAVEYLTKQVFKESFNRAHLIEIDSVSFFKLVKEDE